MVIYDNLITVIEYVNTYNINTYILITIYTLLGLSI